MILQIFVGASVVATGLRGIRHIADAVYAWRKEKDLKKAGCEILAAITVPFRAITVESACLAQKLNNVLQGKNPPVTVEEMFNRLQEAFNIDSSEHPPIKVEAI